jgi:peptidoglycan L-alanyl-D-glutamate endopeptidase CwlK
MNFKIDIRFAQRFLACAGLYTDKIDGLYGNNTRKAEDAFNKLLIKYADQYGRFDDRTEGVIATLLPNAQIQARKFMLVAKDFRLTVKLIGGTRSYAEQDDLYKKRPKVTNAKGGQSNHNFGIAWDIGIFSGNRYYTGATSAEEKAYDDLSKLIMPTLGDKLSWGGNWKSFKDKPHYEMTTNKSISQVRALFEAGKLKV